MGKFGAKSSKCLVSNETRYKEVFGGADSKIAYCFLNSVLKIPFLGKFWSRKLKLYVLNKTQYSEVFKRANSGYSFSARFFLKSNTNEPHSSFFLT